MEFINRLINALVDVHPLHSMTVHFPIALTGTALLFLVLALWRRNEALEQAAFYLITLSAVSTIVAGLTGYRDYMIRFEGDAPLVNVKIFLGVTLFGLTTVIALTRWRRSEILWRPSTMILYLSAFAGSFGLATVLGFLGGVILYGF
ncbi:MAG: hypothetical protein JSV81_07445 [Anaerolineales bacterium]|nr:MAG: hypothetical protein JSV81_07445 [Anaerolineales bacterium]